MNSKDIAAVISENTKTFDEIVDILIDDAKALVKQRNAKIPDAVKSCYMEQNSKWEAACRKLKSDDTTKLWEAFKKHPNVPKLVVVKAPAASQESSAPLEKVRSTIDSLAKTMLKQFLQVDEMVAASVEAKALTADERRELAIEVVVADIVKHFSIVSKDLKDRLDTIGLIGAAAKRAQQLNTSFAITDERLVAVFSVVSGLEGISQTNALSHIQVMFGLL